MNQKIVLTTEDHARLCDLIAENGCKRDKHDAEAFSMLTREVQRAQIVAPEDIPPRVVTMNSTVNVLDMDTQEKMKFTLCWPEDADPSEGRINVLAPLGMALLGTMTGDEVEWRVPSGIRRFRIRKVVFQPESEKGVRDAPGGSELAFPSVLDQPEAI